ncbi:hypothetical protein [Desulfosporosinus fructosivorans]|uniref:hypothetical protein n=1 Tax=Desulfosporosinus fructosivorans TaxID=2018669 RepID=UPI00130DEC5D|nr:hypothetical protein [Desulfosporosinus fructosivorans]
MAESSSFATQGVPIGKAAIVSHWRLTLPVTYVTETESELPLPYGEVRFTIG